MATMPAAVLPQVLEATARSHTHEPRSVTVMAEDQFCFASSRLHTRVHRNRDERLPNGLRFASELLDADTSSGSVIKLTRYDNLYFPR
jgi:hypothetical protein